MVHLSICLFAIMMMMRIYYRFYLNFLPLYFYKESHNILCDQVGCTNTDIPAIAIQRSHIKKHERFSGQGQTTANAKEATRVLSSTRFSEEDVSKGSLVMSASIPGGH